MTEQPGSSADNNAEAAAQPINEIVEAETKTQEDPFAKGRERMDKIKGFFSGMKEKAKTMASSASDKISKFWDKSKKFGGEATAAVLSADVLADKFDKHTDQKANELGQSIGGAIASGIHEAKKWNQVIGETNREMVADVKQDLTKGYEWSKNKINQVGNKIVDTAASIEDWQNKKIDQAAEIVREGKDLAIYVKELAVNKTVEKFNQAKEGVTKQYDKVAEYGEKAMTAGKMKVASIKENYRKWVNDRRLARIAEQRQREMDTVQAELDAAAVEAASVANMEQSISERKKQLAKEIEEKIELLARLQMAA